MKLNAGGSAIALVVLIVLAFALAVLAGDGRLDWPETALDWRIVAEIRLPRAIAAFVTGSLLALAGVLMQVLLRNPLADPYVLGVSGGAAAFALGAMLLGLSLMPIGASAFAGAIVASIIVFTLGRGPGPWSTSRMLLTGVVMAAGWGAVISLMLTLGDDRSLRGMLFWLIGDLSYARAPLWLIGLPLLALLLALFRARSLNVLAAGETQALLLGENPNRRFIELYVLGALLTAVAVALAGTVGFVGLVVPHLVRLAIGADHRRLLPTATLAGGAFLVLADTLARNLLAPRQLPVGVVTALIGVPLFLVLLRKAGRRNA